MYRWQQFAFPYFALSESARSSHLVPVLPLLLPHCFPPEGSFNRRSGGARWCLFPFPLNSELPSSARIIIFLRDNKWDAPCSLMDFLHLHPSLLHWSWLYSHIFAYGMLLLLRQQLTANKPNEMHTDGSFVLGITQGRMGCVRPFE